MSDVVVIPKRKEKGVFARIKASYVNWKARRRDKRGKKARANLGKTAGRR